LAKCTIATFERRAILSRSNLLAMSAKDVTVWLTTAETAWFTAVPFPACVSTRDEK